MWFGKQEREPKAGLEAGFRIAVAFAMTLAMLALCVELALFLWRDHSANKFSGLDLMLAPLALAAGLAIGAVTGRWRLKALKEMAPLLIGKTLLFEKTALANSKLGRKALTTEKDSYAILFGLFLAVWGGTMAVFMPVGSAAFFVLGVWLAGQSVPYYRLWRWQRNLPAQSSPHDSGQQSGSLEEMPRSEFASSSKETEPPKPFDPKLRIALILLAIFPCSTIAVSFWKERVPGIFGVPGAVLALAGLAVGMTGGQLIGRWRLRALHEVSAQLTGKVFLHEPAPLFRSDSGQKAVTREKLAISIVGLCCIVWAALSYSFFLPTAILIYFLLGLLMTSQAAPYLRFWLIHKRSIG